MKILISLSYRVAKYFDNQSIDFRKFNEHFQKSLGQELDFKNELVNLERTRNCFYKYDSLYLPKTYLTISGKRALVMEFMKGEKIDDIDKLKSLFGEEGPL